MGKMKPCNETESEPVGAGVAPGRDDMRRAGSGLEDLLERIRRIDGDHDPVDLEAVLVHVGRRSFGGIVLFFPLKATILLEPLALSQVRRHSNWKGCYLFQHYES